MATQKHAVCEAATEEQMRTVLGSLDTLYIPGEWAGGADTSGLDNVVMTSAPEPSTLVLLAVGAISLLGYGWRQRRAR